ncbi:MAG: hypothetical protein ACI865_002589 [Flavobacteriaceae bacterium]|jgi:hypothetical protein
MEPFSYLFSKHIHDMSTEKASSSQDDLNVVLIGVGVMSATLGIFIKRLVPFAKIAIYERSIYRAGCRCF